ncbi:type I restriction-modification system endonuclease [Myroides odoratimimus]|uniref:type I restriction-modification system endonuclease n=1 Tax=Myroides odoratimimus TaxID=76832 RepID=UPI0025773DC1|nr:type I restriction-modification system endonuclease [Myroides odoratimimus]MDM1679857.1 type I restriction-modification system endonuclease [Myroides odoratimimus]
MTPFFFLEKTYPDLYNNAILAEKLYFIDPSSSISKNRLLGEKLLHLIAVFEKVDLENRTQVNAIQYLFNINILPDSINSIFHIIRKSGNSATHVGESESQEALYILKKTYSLLVWFYETYENDFIETKNYSLSDITNENDVDDLKSKVDNLTIQLKDYENKINELNSNNSIINSRRLKGKEKASKIEWNELETRIHLIDEQLRQAGWECDTESINFKTHRILPEKGKYKAIAEWPCGGKYADYALFVGLELYGLIEAKKFGIDISTNLRQSKVYAEKVIQNETFNIVGNWNEYNVPFIFSTNGRDYFEQAPTKSGIWFQDIRKETNRAYPLRGWYSPESLKEFFERNIEEANLKLETSDYDYLTSINGLGLRPYQIDAIKNVEHKIINQPEEKSALLVMATGTGKTRTINGLIYRLIKADRFKRILFLTDRRLLAQQASDSIKENKVESQRPFGDIYPLSDLKCIRPDSTTRLHFATVQSMVKRLFYSNQAPLTVDTYDCIIIDEAHRGYNLDKEMDEEDVLFRDQNDYIAQYRRVLDYFDAYKIGMTATPALHTTIIFGKPTFEYSYRQAVIDGNLVDHEPPYTINTLLNTEGIVWEAGEKPSAYDPETGEILDISELEDELRFEVEHFNKQVLNENFNRVVVQELVNHLDPEGDAKTLIFAARDEHADTIVRLLKEEFENVGVDLHDKAIEKITGSVYENEQLTKNFKNERYPNIVVTVDLLSTGIDIPKISNLVFLRRVKSRILYEQMIGRATRPCNEINKESFKIFDAVHLYEAMEDITTMRPVGNPTFTFTQLANEAELIESENRLEKQRDQILAKLNRKVSQMSNDQKETFAFNAANISVDEFMEQLKNSNGNDLRNLIIESHKLWEYLDIKIYRPRSQFISTHHDEVTGITRGYGEVEKPEDYIENFTKFITDNRNKIEAINIICTKPQELDRKSLKELRLILDQNGYSEEYLNTAWKSMNNVEIATDIIAYIRTLSIGTDLISPDQRIKNAISTIKQKHRWTVIQLKWIDRFEKQLLAETVLQKQDLDLKPFVDEGGFKRLDKIFNNKLEDLIKELNNNLYSA